MIVKHIAVSVVLGVSLSLAHIGGVQAAVSYAPPVSISTSATPDAAAKDPEYIAKGELNNDGDMDLVTVNETDDTVTVLLSNGAGGFSSVVPYAVGDTPTQVAIGDLNGDGFNDLVVPNTRDRTISVLINNGAGGFADPLFPPLTIDSVTYIGFAGAGTMPTSAIIADLDGDGFADIAVSNDITDNVQILLGDGGTSFSPGATITVGDKPVYMTAYDLDGGGDTDLLVANFDAIGGTVSVLENNGSGGFSVIQTLTTGARPWSIKVGLINSDLLPDLALANYNVNSTVKVFLGDGVGPFATTEVSSTTVALKPHSVEITELNGDGFADIVVSNDNDPAPPATSATTGVTVLFGDGAGLFPTVTFYPLGGQPNGVVSLDLDGVNQLDLAVANGITGDVDVLLNVPATAAPVASDGALAVTEDTATNGTLSATDADGALLSYSIVANGAKGTAVITNFATGAFTYTPNAGETGGDSFTFKANDGTADSNAATITVTITAVASSGGGGGGGGCSLSADPRHAGFDPMLPLLALGSLLYLGRQRKRDVA